MRTPLSVFALLCLGMFLGPIPARPAPNMLSEYHVRRWQAEDGLGESIVNGIHQSLDGFLWCVTQNQVLRFDGVRFSPIDTSQEPSFPLRGITTGRGGELWVYGAGQVLRNSGKKWEGVFSTPDRSKLLVKALEEDARGITWAATPEGIFQLGNAAPLLFACAENGVPMELLEMDLAFGGKILVVAKTREGARLFRFQEGAYVREMLPQEHAQEEIIKVHIGPTGTVWIATDHHLLRNLAGTWEVISYPEAPHEPSGVRTLLERQNGELWMGTVRGLLRLREGQWSELTTRDGFFPFAVRSLKEDREGGLWVAGTGGLMRLTTKNLGVYSSGLGLDKEPFVSLMLKGTEWWAGVAGMGPLVGTPGKFQRLPNHSSLEATTASAFLKARDGSIWIGTHSRGLWRFKDGRGEKIVNPRGTDAASGAITALQEDRGGKIWVGTLGGLSTVTSGTLSPFQTRQGFLPDTVNVLHEDAEGNLWVGYQSRGLMQILRDGSLIQFQKGEGLPSNSIRTIYRDRMGVIWVGTAEGLVRKVQNGHAVFNTSHGLAEDAIRQIIEDDSGFLWLGSRYGLMRINHSEFLEVETGAKATLAVRSFGLKDGMNSEECTGAAPVKTPDGKIWFPTTDGLVMVDPKTLPTNTEVPKVFLEEVRVNSRSIWSVNPLPIPSERMPRLAVSAPAELVEFRFTSVDFVAPDRVCFRYRLEGLSEEWSAPTNVRVVSFPKLLPGSYRFRVQACSRDGAWSIGESSIALTVPALFWQTLWFKAGMGSMGLSAVALGFFAWERRKARQKLRELEHEQTLDRERARIARDIHDEVGAGLTEVALLSELAQAGTDCQNYLDDIFKTARDLTVSLNEIVWSINPANDSLEKLVSYLVEFARDFLGTASLPCRLQVPTELPEITVESSVRHQICLVVKEVLNNIVKHAEATEVHMEICWDQQLLQILIRDNGRGFDRTALVDPASSRDGLENMEVRMREIGGVCIQQSQIGEGTSTKLSVKLPTACP